MAILLAILPRVLPYLIPMVLVWMVTAGGCNRLNDIKHNWAVRRAVAKAVREAEARCRDSGGQIDRDRRWWRLRADAPDEEPPLWHKFCAPMEPIELSNSKDE